MSGLARRLVVFAALEGLIVQPYGNSSNGPRHSDSSCIRIDYKTRKVSLLAALPPELGDKKDSGLELYGLVGLLSVSSYSFLISITQREQVAQIQGKPVYAVTNVALIPVSSQAEAAKAISQARGKSLAPSDSDSDDESASDGTDTPVEELDAVVEVNGPEDFSGMSAPTTATTATAVTSGLSHQRSPSQSRSRIAQDVIGNKVPFGRFAANWLSRKALGMPGLGTVAGQADAADPAIVDASAEDAALDLTVEVQDREECIAPGASPPKAGDGAAESRGASVQSSSDRTTALLPKLLRYTKLLFASRNFFYSHEYDLTRPIGVYDATKSSLPFHKAVDPLYFWNKHLTEPLIEADAHSFVLPLIQGFVGQCEFTVLASKPEPTQGETPLQASSKSRILGEKKEAQAVVVEDSKRDFLLTLISRRSIKRPGLRYLRRGVDDDGNVANFVETEQILSVPDWEPTRSIYSYLQLRGSIPLYFSQSPYSLKPVPVLHHTAETNQLAFDRHFRTLGRRYGKVQAVSLVDKHGGEQNLGEQYERYTQCLNNTGGVDGKLLGFFWFDFHRECRGMKFENVKILVDSIEATLNDFGDSVIQDNTVVRSQTGIVRTNCMDCLDRTGVAQCAFGGWALKRQLQSEGIEIDLQDDTSTQWFNTIWADNGDAISKQYASTAALKGDYTRTRKRNYRGALNDFGLTLSRFYNNLVNDFFSQACVDYLQGTVSTQVFSEFETEMQTADPGISVQRMRQSAIDVSCKIVISDLSEELLGGWTMLTPRQPNTLRTLPFEESVLLLTTSAIYSCRFDWNTDKVLSFERVDLRSIERLTCGTYITSVMTDAQTDEKRNVGIVIVYHEGNANALRVNTRSLRSSVSATASDAAAAAAAAAAATATTTDIITSTTTSSATTPADAVANTKSAATTDCQWFRGGLGRNKSWRKSGTSRFLAFKVLPLSTSVVAKQKSAMSSSSSSSSIAATAAAATAAASSLRSSSTVTEADFVRSICSEIERAAAEAHYEGDSLPQLPPDKRVAVEEAAIIPLADARKRTGYLESFVYDLKKMVWA